MVLLPYLLQATELVNHVPKHANPQSYIASFGVTNLHLVWGLPLHNQAELDTLLADLYNPASTNYHKFLSPTEFATRFSPTEVEYAKVIAFAQSNGFIVTKRHANRFILEVDGTTPIVERGLGVKMGTYHHPDGRTIYAPNKNPLIPSGIDVQDIQGLTDDNKPKPASVIKEAGSATAGSYTGLFIGKDFRKAFAADTSMTGSGQLVGLVEFDGYYAADITKYATKAGIAVPAITKVLLDGMTGSAGTDNSEVALDIDMSMSLAPGAGIVVFEGQSANTILGAMVARTDIKQFSCSWIWSGGINQSTDNLFKQMAAQGQSFFQASGDSDGYRPGLIPAPSDSPYITLVGGTTLSTDNSGNYVSETVWNWAYNPNGTLGSSGGVSGNYTLPYWQQGVSTAVNGASTTMRNVPDVAMPADKIFVIYNNGTANELGGTSCAAPLWAAFTALVNQQATQSGKPSIGFLNPALYALAQTSAYASVLHDITVGNNFVSNSVVGYYAKPGYDLCTGLGSPVGQATINALSGTSGATTSFTGAIQVSVNTGGTWLLDGVSYASGAVVTGLTPIVHTLSFPAVSGWQAPTNRTILAFAGSTNTQYYNYTQASVVQVNITPSQAVAAGAGWYLDGTGSKHPSGSIVTASVGTHTVVFSTATNWQAPSSMTIATVGGVTNVFSNVYSLQNGWLKVTLTPTNIVNSVNWVVNGNVLNSGNLLTLPAGVYPINFTPVAGWYSPSNANITVSGNKTNAVSFAYKQIPVGNIKVTVNPVGQWALDGGSYRSSGTLSNVVAGTHQMSFLGIQTWLTPTNRTIVIPTNATLTLTYTYMPVSGTYAGLFYNTNEVSVVDSGAIWLQIFTNRTISGKLQILTNTWSLTGSLSDNGTFSCTSAIPIQTLNMNPDARGITGQLGLSGRTQVLSAFSTPYTGSNKTTNSGNYTLVLPGDSTMGYGFGALNIASNGFTSFTGMLADGTACSTTNSLNYKNEMAWYIPLVNQGVFLGWSTVTNQSISDLQGVAYWSMPSSPNSFTFPAGFTNYVNIYGSKYSVTSTNMLRYKFTMSFASPDGTLNQSNFCYFGSGNKFTNAGPAACSMIVSTNGMFSGTVSFPSNQIPFGGVIYEKLYGGYGLFPWAHYTGSLNLY